VHFFRHRPFPNWVKLGAAGLLALVAFALYFNGRFFLAYWEIRGAFRAAGEADVARAADLMDSAAEHVPESPDLEVFASYFRGIQLLSAEKSAEALAHLEKVGGRLPSDFRVDALVLQARMGKCFDEKDYDGFLEHALEMAERDPDEPRAVAQVASAYACKYAVTEDAQFKEKALEALGRAKAMAQKDPDFAEYEDRILHRIESRQIIPRKEFQKRFPNGWHGKEEPER
jgi:tetratricopeptide (TPR) repeat protein